MGNSNSGVMPGVVPSPVKVEKMKVLLLGPPLVGKSCLFKRYVSMKFHENYEPDLTANIGSKLVGIDGLPTVNLELWDIPGTLDPQLEDIYFKDVDGAILVFDVANAKQSTEELAKWFDRLAAYEQRVGIETVPKLKFGNKRDLIHGVLWHNYDSSKAPPRKGRRAKFAAFATCPSFTVSAKDFGGIHSAFKQMIAEIYNDRHPIAVTSTPDVSADNNSENATESANPDGAAEETTENVEPAKESDRLAGEDGADVALAKSASERSVAPDSPDDPGSVESKSGMTRSSSSGGGTDL